MHAIIGEFACHRYIVFMLEVFSSTNVCFMTVFRSIMYNWTVRVSYPLWYFSMFKRIYLADCISSSQSILQQVILGFNKLSLAGMNSRPDGQDIFIKMTLQSIRWRRWFLYSSVSGSSLLATIIFNIFFTIPLVTIRVFS